MLYGWGLISEEEKRLIAEGIRKCKTFGGPYHIVLFPTDRCNLDCFFCYTEGLRRQAKEIEWDVLQRALAEGVAMGVKSVSLGGGGEPLIYTALLQLLDFTEAHHLKIDSIKTNGTALTDAVALRLIRSGLRRITISLNETDPFEYAGMGRVSPHLFGRAMKGIDNIIEAKRTADSDCEVSVQIFVWRENYGRLPNMIEALLPTGADFIYVNTMEGLPAEKKMTGTQKEEFRGILRDVIEKNAQRLQFNLTAEGLQQYAESEQYRVYPQAIDLPDICRTDKRVEFCYIGWYAVVIEASGDVYPCCHFATDPAKSLGNLHTSTLREIWYGGRANKFRREMRHLLLTDADKRLLPRRSRFIHPLCLERTACAFNYYLCDPAFYINMNRWAKKNGGPYRIYQVLKSLTFRIGHYIRNFQTWLKV